jgi:CheY-like chemotaxis protein
MDNRLEPRVRLRKMIIADDDPAVLRLLADRCAKMGFQVETAMNGVQLLVKVRHNHPDILICDINMPALDGLSVCTNLLNPGRKPLEVVVITGGDDEEAAERCEGLGMFFGRKGPNFWNEISAALLEIYPDLAERMDTLAPAPPVAAMQRRPLVLVVDGDPDFGKLLAGQLAGYGIYTLYAADAVDGCRIAAEDRPNLIVADYYTPDGDAQFLLDQLRAAPATAAIPVVVVSANKLGDVYERNLKRDISGWPGACAVLPKSFDTAVLFEVMRKYCSFGRPAAQLSAVVETDGR